MSKEQVAEKIGCFLDKYWGVIVCGCFAVVTVGFVSWGMMR